MSFTIILFESLLSAKTSKFNIFTLGKKASNFDSTKIFKLLYVGSLDCSNKKLLNPPPNDGFKGISPGFVRKKFKRLFFISSCVVYVEVKTAGLLNGIFIPSAIFGFKSLGSIYCGLKAI